MPTITFKATEMRDAKVAHISLVDRAATRIPFKVIKQEKPMRIMPHLDLASVFKKEKAGLNPEIMGVVTLKSDSGFESVKGQIEEAGFATDTEVAFEDGSVIFGQVEEMDGEHVLIRLSDSAVMAVRGFKPYAMQLTQGDNSFEEGCVEQGYYPGVGAMVQSLGEMVISEVSKSDNPALAATNVAKMFDEAKKYAVSMVTALPAKAFKLETIFPEEDEIPTEELELYDTVLKDSAASSKAWLSRRKNKAQADSDQKSTYQMFLGQMANDTRNARAKANQKTTARMLAGHSAHDTMAQKKKLKGNEPGAKFSGATTAFARKEEGTDEDFVEFLTEIVNSTVSDKFAELVGKMDEAVGAITSSVEELSSRVATAETVAKAANKALSGTVVLGGDGGDHMAAATKSEYRGREIDTAFSPRRRT